MSASLESKQILAVIPSIGPPSVRGLVSMTTALRDDGVRTLIVANSRNLALDLDGHNEGYVTEHSNVGFSRSINFGAAQDSLWKWLLILNDDVVVDQKAFSVALRELDESGLDDIVYYDPERRRIPRRIDVLFQVSLLGRIMDHGWTQRPLDPLDSYHSFSAVAISRRAWMALGGFDESLRFTYEDADFVIRARSKGLSARFRAESGVEHLHSVSTGRYIDRVLPVAIMSSVAYLRKWYGGIGGGRALILIGLAIRLPLSVFTQASKRRHIRGIFRAACAVVKNDPESVSLPGFESLA